MRSCDSRCLFSGSKGEVCCIEPLRAPPDFRDHPITLYSLLAMASLTKVRAPASGPVSSCRLSRLLAERGLLAGPAFSVLCLDAAALFRSDVSVFCFLYQILVIGLKPSLKVWMTLPYSKVCVLLCMLMLAQFFACRRTLQQL